MTLELLEDLFWKAFDKEVEINGDNGNGERAGIAAVIRALRDDTAINSCACKFWLDDILGDTGEKKSDPAPAERSDATAVCEWTRARRWDDRTSIAYSLSCSGNRVRLFFKIPEEACPACGKPIKFTEAK